MANVDVVKVESPAVLLFQLLRVQQAHSARVVDCGTGNGGEHAQEFSTGTGRAGRRERATDGGWVGGKDGGDSGRDVAGWLRQFEHEGF